jgi:5'-nucleotidase
VPPERRIFCNRTLNIRALRAVGYDMDYTLLHYRVQEWECRAFEHARLQLAARGWPVEELRFEPDEVSQGLAVDIELGNLVKPTRFGWVIAARHGTRQLPFDEVRSAYEGVLVDLAEPRFRFLNTMFSLSEASLYGQLVDLLDGGQLSGVRDYDDVYGAVVQALDESHTAGVLKAEIIADPDRFLVLEPDTAAAILDQRSARKKTMLITNSDWAYTTGMMSYAFDRFAPSGSWRDLFDIVIVSANKPAFFAERQACYRVVDEARGLLEPHRGLLESGHAYFGGNARLVEDSLDLDGEQILYVGDHLFGDVHVSKDILRWRTALILREIEAEICDSDRFEPDRRRLDELMEVKVDLERQLATLRLARARHRDGREPLGRPARRELEAAIAELVEQVGAVDADIAPLAQAASQLGNPVWGPLMRAGSDKSLFARQVERYADVYTSRVGNLVHETPFAYLRAARSTLPHDV